MIALASTRSQWVVAGLLSFYTVGWQDFQSQKVLALAPWFLLAALGAPGRDAIRQICSRYRFAFVATVVLFGVIVVTDALHGVSKVALRHALAAVSWLPIAAIALRLFQSDREALRRTAIAVACGVGVAAVVTSTQFALLGHARPLGLNHNVLSGTLALIGLVVTVALMQTHTCAGDLGASDAARSRQSDARWVALAIVGAIFVVVLSGARSPLLAVTATAIVLLALLRRRLRVVALLVIFGMVAAVLVLGYARFADIAAEVVAYVGGEHHSSIGARLDAWRWFGESGLSSPWIGLSPDGVKASLALRGERWGVAGKGVVEMWHLHNDIIGLFAAYGFLAPLAYLAMMAGFIATATRTIFRERTRAPLCAIAASVGLVAVVLLVLVAGLTDSMTYWSTSWVAWSAGIAMLLAAQMMQPAHR